MYAFNDVLVIPREADVGAGFKPARARIARCTPTQPVGYTPPGT